MAASHELEQERAARRAIERELAATKRALHLLQHKCDVEDPNSDSSSEVILDDRLWRWMDQLSDGFAVFDTSQVLIAANAAYLRVLNLAGDLGIGSSYTDIVLGLLAKGMIEIDDDDREEWQRNALARWEKDVIPDISIRLESGAYFKIIDRRIENGDIVSLAVDVTHLMQMWAGVEAIPDGFVIYDRNENFVVCNQKYKEIYTESAEVMTPGTSFRDILKYGLDRGQYAEAIGREDEWLEQRLAEHRGASSIVEQQLKDGRWLRILEKATPDGGRVGLRVDISEQKAQQRALEKARIQAEAASRAKSAFLANMSHELRTPMNGVVGMADILCETQLSDEQRLYAETIRNSGESLMALLNDVLDFSKIEADKLTLRPEAFDLERTIHEVVMLMRGNAMRKGLELYIDYDMFHPTRFVGDRGRIRQILTNLIGNAVKFTDSGHVLVRVVGVESDTPGHQQIHLTVEDTGIGVSPDMQAHIFEEFRQVEDAETRKYEGTGLGLAITKRLAELMGGELWLDSVKGKGSCFGVRLVLPISEPEAVTEVPVDLDGARLLVVDDQQVNLTILDRQLTPAGSAITCVTNAPEALALLRGGEKFDLVITDNLMPDMDGLQFSQEVRELFPQLPIMMLTSDPTVLSNPDALQYIDRILQKPTLRVTLHDTVAAMLAGEVCISTERAKLSAVPDGSPMRILAAEDNRTNQLVFGKILKDLNVEVQFADNGQEAVDAFSKCPPDLIFMDVSMPGMDGKTATRIIREMEMANNATPVPVIALTAHALPGDDADILAAGMDAYMTKPLRKAEILQAIHTHAPANRAPLQNSG